MKGKRKARRVIVPLPPRGLRPKLTRDQVIELGVCHLTNLDLIARGQADTDVLWHMVGSVFTWSRVADLLGVGIDEMRAQLEMVTSLVERYGRTGRVGFNGLEYQVAKFGIEVMDRLAEIVDTPTALAAATWGEARVQALANQTAAAQPERQAA